MSYGLIKQPTALIVVGTGLLGLFLSAGNAQAQYAEDCPPLVSLPTELTPQANAVWLDHLSVCQRDTAYLSAFGQRLNQQQRYAEAHDHLERALLLDPNLKAARIEYAIALAGVGQVSGAEELLLSLLAEPDLPPSLRALLLGRRQRLLVTQSNSTARWITRTTAALRVGHDSNLSGAPNLQSLTLTMGNQVVQLPLDASYQARPGTYARADLLFEARHPYALGQPHAQWNLAASLRARRTPSTAGGDATLADVVAEYTQYTPATPVATIPAASLQAHKLHTGPWVSAAVGSIHAQAGAARHQSVGISAGWGGTGYNLLGQQCQLRTGAEWQQRQHLSNPVLSGRYAGLLGVLSCQWHPAHWLASLRVGTDHEARTNRPGGDQQQASLRLAAWLPVGLLTEAEFSRYHDGAAYSPLLGGGAVRTINRQAWRIQYEWAWTGTSMQAVAGIEWVRQQSSLDLFRMRSQGPYIGLRGSW